jgi:hypothetical protein
MKRQERGGEGTHDEVLLLFPELVRDPKGVLEESGDEQEASEFIEVRLERFGDLFDGRLDGTRVPTHSLLEAMRCMMMMMMMMIRRATSGMKRSAVWSTRTKTSESMPFSAGSWESSAERHSQGLGSVSFRGTGV